MLRPHWRFVALLLLAVSSDVRAQEPQTPLSIDTDRSRIYVFVGKTGFGHEHGIEGLVKSGSIALGAAEGAGRIDFDMTSFDADTELARRYVGLKGTTSESTRKQVNDNMLGPDVLDVAKFPTATFSIRSARLLPQQGAGLPTYELAGDFTLHGVKRPLRLVAKATDYQGQTRVRGSFSILQTDYGITPYSAALGAVGVTDKLTIWGDILLGAPANQANEPGKTTR